MSGGETASSVCSSEALRSMRDELSFSSARPPFGGCADEYHCFSISADGRRCAAANDRTSTREAATAEEAEFCSGGDGDGDGVFSTEMALRPLSVAAFVLSLLCSSSVLALNASTSGVEVEALLAFKASVSDDPTGALADWTSASHHCNWSGVACDPQTNAVVALSLIETRLKGTISPYLANIYTLEVIDFTSNSFHGPVPAQLGLMSGLQELTLPENCLSGAIPPELGNLKNLQWHHPGEHMQLHSAHCSRLQ